MSKTGHCVQGTHGKCPDAIKDDWVCDCACHLIVKLRMQEKRNYHDGTIRTTNRTGV